MAAATGWIAVDVNLSDYPNEITIEFDDVEDLMKAANENNIFEQDILSYILEGDSVDLLDVLSDVSIADIIGVLDRKIKSVIQDKDLRLEMLVKRNQDLNHKLLELETPTTPSSI
jgi:hypothetical protein